MEGNSYPSVEYDLDMTDFNYPSGPLSGKPPSVGESEGVYNIGPSTTDYDMYTYSGMLYNTECRSHQPIRVPDYHWH